MRYFLSTIVFLLVASFAVAQETTAVAIEGWDQNIGSDGVVYYRCASSICAASSVVSYKEQPHRTSITLESFEKHHLGLARQNKGQGRVRDAVISSGKERIIDGVRVMQISREVHWTDDSTTYSIEARLVGARSYSLVSDSPQREWTANNFEGFLLVLVNLAGIASR